jgi:ribonuclease HII
MSTGQIIICGGDEAGRGALIGPLVVALVAIKKSNTHKLTDIGVRDSKLLSRRRRENLYGTIKEIAVDVKVSKIMPAEINEAMRRNISLNELEATHFAKLFNNVPVDVSTLYLDSPDVIPEKFGMRVNLSSNKPTKIKGVPLKRQKGIKYTNIIAEHKADSIYPVVSAASIIAKVERDWEIDKIAKQLGLEIGSGYPADSYTIATIKENMKNEALKQHIRQYWQTMYEIKQTKLTNF